MQTELKNKKEIDVNNNLLENTNFRNNQNYIINLNKKWKYIKYALRKNGSFYKIRDINSWFPLKKFNPWDLWYIDYISDNKFNFFHIISMFISFNIFFYIWWVNDIQVFWMITFFFLFIIIPVMIFILPILETSFNLNSKNYIIFRHRPYFKEIYIYYKK